MNRNLPPATDDLASLALLEQEKRRLSSIAELQSDLHTPEMRIQLWEKLYRLRMPRDPQHPILGVIATRTRLTLSQVLQTQSDRQARVDPR